MHTTIHLMDSVHTLITRKINNNEDLVDADIYMISNYLDTILKVIKNSNH
ncbi:hypothetical protein [Inediibacterium massiliense]|nr:hypothetical protein [Inediibacterium massiliense]